MPTPEIPISLFEFSPHLPQNMAEKFQLLIPELQDISINDVPFTELIARAEILPNKSDLSNSPLAAEFCLPQGQTPYHRAHIQYLPQLGPKDAGIDHLRVILHSSETSGNDIHPNQNVVLSWDKTEEGKMGNLNVDFIGTSAKFKMEADGLIVEHSIRRFNLDNIKQLSPKWRLWTNRKGKQMFTIISQNFPEGTDYCIMTLPAIISNPRETERNWRKVLLKG